MLTILVVLLSGCGGGKSMVTHPVDQRVEEPIELPPGPPR
jgi:hypothetical protein